MLRGKAWDKGNMKPKPKPPKEVPFVGTTIGPYIGFKIFQYMGAGRPRIVSSFRTSFEWWPNRSLEVADCRVSDSAALWKTKRDVEHEVPDDVHGCGFYMYYELDQAVQTAYSFHYAAPLVGEFVCMVAAWGDVVHHEKGTRSSHMEIVAFHDGPYDFPKARQEFAEEMRLPYLEGHKLEDAKSLFDEGRVEDAKEKYGVFL